MTAHDLNVILHLIGFGMLTTAIAVPPILEIVRDRVHAFRTQRQVPRAIASRRRDRR